MIPQKSLIVFMIVTIVLIGVSFGLGLDYGYKIKNKEIAKFWSSKIVEIEDFSARGEVIKISGKNLTLTAEGETLEISIKEEAEIFLWVLSEGKLKEEEGQEKEGQVLVSNPVGFDEIKVGDFVSIVLSLGEKDFEGERVTISHR